MNAKLMLSAVTLALLATTAFAKPPANNINPARHANLAAAQRLSTQAFEKITAAQRANEFDLDGHAAKAKDLLEQVNRELKAAAETSNAHGH